MNTGMKTGGMQQDKVGNNTFGNSFDQQLSDNKNNLLNRVSYTFLKISYNSSILQNMSTSQLAAAANAAEVEAHMDAQKEVELKAQGENSQLFQDSVMQQQRISRMGQQPGLLGSTGAAIMGGPSTGFPGFQSGSGRIDGGHYGSEARITMNLEDVVLHEQKLSTILEVSAISLF